MFRADWYALQLLPCSHDGAGVGYGTHTDDTVEIVTAEKARTLKILTVLDPALYSVLLVL